MSLLPPTVRAVFFDAVGTLLFPAPAAPLVYAEYARRYEAVCDADRVRSRLAAAFAAEEVIDRAAGWVTSEAREVERWRRIVAASLVELPDPSACFRDLYEHFARPDAWVVNTDAGDVFRVLAERGLVLGLASNYDSRLPRVLAGRPELAPVADRVVISSAVGWRKPSSRFFQAVARIAGYTAGEVLYVGDDFVNDYRGAAEAGMPTVLLEDRVRHPSVARIRRLRDLVL